MIVSIALLAYVASSAAVADGKTGSDNDTCTSANAFDLAAKLATGATDVCWKGASYTPPETSAASAAQAAQSDGTQWCKSDDSGACVGSTTALVGGDDFAAPCAIGDYCNCKSAVNAIEGSTKTSLCVAQTAVAVPANAISASNTYHADGIVLCQDSAAADVFKDLDTNTYCDGTPTLATIAKAKFPAAGEADSEYAPQGIVANKKQTICARKTGGGNNTCLADSVTGAIADGINMDFTALQVCAPGDLCNCAKSTAVSKAAKNVITSLCVKPEAIMPPGTIITATRTICVKTGDILEECNNAKPYCPIGGGACATDYVAPPAAADVKSLTGQTTPLLALAAMEPGLKNANTDWASDGAVLKQLAAKQADLLALAGKAFNKQELSNLKTIAGYATIGPTAAWGDGHTHTASPGNPGHHHPFAAVSMAALLSA